MQRKYILFALVSLAVFGISFEYGRKARAHHHTFLRNRWLASIATRGIGGAPSRVFAEVLENLEQGFVDRITDERPLTQGALRGMADALGDSRSRYLTPEEARGLIELQDGTAHGIGAVIEPVGKAPMRRLVVVSVLPGSPAEKAGLKPGEVIMKIDDKFALFPPMVRMQLRPRDADGKVTPGPGTPEPEKPEEIRDDDIMNLYESYRTLSEDGRSISLVVKGKAPNTLESFAVQTGPTAVRSVETSQPRPDVTLIRIGGFTRTIGPDLDRALARASGSKGIVLDLRGCIGGPQDRALQVLSRFADGPMGSVERRTDAGMARAKLAVNRTENAWTGKLVVLADKTTAGNAEWLAGALTASGRAKLVGARTYGDGFERSLIPFRDGSAYLLTTGKYFLPDGKAYAGAGLTPGVLANDFSRQVPTAVTVLQEARG